MSSSPSNPTTTPQQITSQIKSQGLFDQWRASLSQKYQASSHHDRIRQMVLERLSNANPTVTKPILSNTSLTREQKFEALLRIMYQDRELHEEIKRELGAIVQRELEGDMRRHCNEIMQSLESSRGESQFQEHSQKMMKSFEKEKVEPLNEELRRDDEMVGDAKRGDWIEPKEEEKVHYVESDELANVAKEIDVVLFDKKNRVDPENLELLKNAGDRITVPILGHFHLVHEKDVVRCILPDKVAIGRISRDNRIRWTDPDTNLWIKFDTLAHYVNHVHLSMEPRSKVPMQFDGWSQCTLIRDGTAKETPMTELREKAIENLRKYALDDRLEQEKVTAFPSFEHKHALKKKENDGLNKHFDQIEQVINENGPIEGFQPNKRRKTSHDE